MWDGITWREKKVLSTWGWLARRFTMRAVGGGGASVKEATLSGDRAPGGKHGIVQIGQLLEDPPENATDLIRETVGSR